MANSVPILSGLDAAAFLENAVNGAAQLIDADVTFPDADGHFSGGTLTVSGLLAEDIVSIRNQGTGNGSSATRPYRMNPGTCRWSSVIQRPVIRLPGRRF